MVLKLSYMGINLTYMELKPSYMELKLTYMGLKQTYRDIGTLMWKILGIIYPMIFHIRVPMSVEWTKLISRKIQMAEKF